MNNEYWATEYFKTAGLPSWIAGLPAALGEKFDRGYKTSPVQMGLRQVSNVLRPAAKRIESIPGRIKNFVAPGGVGQPQPPVHIPQGTGVPYTPQGNVDFDHPHVKSVMDAVHAGHIEVPAHLLEGPHGVSDEVGMWNWAAQHPAH